MDPESHVILDAGSPTRMTGVYQYNPVSRNVNNVHVHYVLDTEDMYGSALRVGRLTPDCNFNASRVFNHLRGVFNLKKP